MRQSVRFTIWSLFVGIVMAGAAYAVTSEEMPVNVAEGKAIYERACIFCHGVAGKGDGPAAFFSASYSAPRPRDFSQSDFKFKSTPAGELPTDQDLFRVVTEGVTGYMPSFRGLTESERWNVIAYLKTFNPMFATASPPTIAVGFPKVPYSQESVTKGRAVYLEQDCQECHGINARGDGELFREGRLRGSYDLPIQPRDLTNRSSFKNGTTARDIFRTIMTGFDGSPMPSHEEEFADHEENAWHLVNYILSLSQEPRP